MEKYLHISKKSKKNIHKICECKKKVVSLPRYFVRIDYHYRLIFQMEAKQGDTLFTICKLEDITNHYKA